MELKQKFNINKLSELTDTLFITGNLVCLSVRIVLHPINFTCIV